MYNNLCYLLLNNGLMEVIQGFLLLPSFFLRPPADGLWLLVFGLRPLADGLCSSGFGFRPLGEAFGLRPKIFANQMLASYRTTRGTAIMICDRGSGGVRMAATMKMRTIIYFLLRASIRASTTPSLERKRMKRGSSKVRPKVSSSMEQKENDSLSRGAGCIKSVAKLMKNLAPRGKMMK